MALKNVLVHMTETAQSELRLETAVALCVKHDAHLTGLIVQALPVLPAYSIGPIPDMVLEPFEAQQDAMAAKARTTFDDIVKRAGWTERSSCTQIEGNVTDIMGLHARYADLTVTGQDIPNEDQWEISTVDLIMRSGRPVLVTPHGVQNKPVGKNVAIAWNASREAARAVADAMPILEAADSVEILTVTQASDETVPGIGIAQHLAHHDIAVEVKRLGASTADAGEALLNYIGNGNTDLLVMGAYGHSRLREFVFGGTTRHILQAMPVPILISH